MTEAAKHTPCPFCGNSKISIVGDKPYLVAHCPKCQAEGPFGKPTEQAAYEAWDTRPAFEAQERLIETLTAALEGCVQVLGPLITMQDDFEVRTEIREHRDAARTALAQARIEQR